MTDAKTLADLAALGELVGRRVRFLATDIPSTLPAGTVGRVFDVRSTERKATARYVREDLHDGHPFKVVDLETSFRNLELAP